MEKSKRKKARGKKAPRVPICTYRWEDLRRAKRKGGYPWTYLYKSPFNELLDPEPFTMEAMRRSKSSSTMSNPEHAVEITELETESRKNSFNPLVTEPEDHSMPKDAPSSSVLIIECPIEVDNKEVLESAESSDNISQYLDREDKNLEDVKSAEEPRAKSEEAHNRKRKHSAESSYSRISLSKLAVMKKLREAKKKMKVPKISLNVSKFKKSSIPKKSSPPETKKESKTKSLHTEKPVYIHIPLKPPPGQTDEFSYLEFGDKKPVEKKKEIKINPAFKGLLKSVRELAEKEKKEDGKSEEPSNETEKTDDKIEEEIVEKMETGQTKEDEKPEIVSEKVEPKDIPEEKTNESTEEEDVFERFFKKPEPKAVEQIPKPSDPRQSRSKSAEPERKRKGSLESSYSRKSLSKLAFIKRLKEATDRVKSTLTRSGSSKKEQKKKPQEKLKEFVNAPVQRKQLQDVKPVYIHIPLKPPEGEEDEFSQRVPETQTESSPEVQTPTKDHDVHLIFLTPPSDDEILEDKLDIPDTPSSETSKFFGGKIDELKALAQQVVDEVSPENKKDKLAPVQEESPNGSKEELKIKEDGGMLVDEEDGLNEAPKVGKPVKKKVSFKRKTKTSTKDDGDYEPIETPKEEKEKLQASRSMSTDEEKTYLDQKIMKETSLEEDYNKWSKTSDQDTHEYEPVNPPEEQTFAVVAPTVTVIDTEKFKDFIEAEDSNRVLPSTTDLKNSELKLDRRIERAEPRTSGQSSNVSDVSKKSDPEKADNEATQPQKVSEGPGKFQLAFKHKTDQLKTKLHNMKKPTFSKPDFKRFKIEKPNIHFPKIPDTTKINLPSFTLPKRSKKSKRVLKTRNYSTESNAGDSSETKKPIFDFSTYPRLFQKKHKPGKVDEVPSFATMPRNTKKEDRRSESDSVRIPLHSEDSVDDHLDLEEQEVEEREDSVERRMAQASRIRYEEDIGVDDAYARENDEINKAEAEKRWQRGSFKSKAERRQVTDLDDAPVNSSDRSNDVGSTDNVGKRYSSDDFAPKPGVMEEIGSDEFMIRQKGISQENIEYRKYLSSEIREAFRTPTNALSQMQGVDPYRDYASGSIQSLPETPSKKKSIKKPKRKKTPHHSQEQIPYDEESVDEFATMPPSRPKRRSKRVRKPKDEDNVVPYQQTIAADDRLAFARESLGILGDDEREEIEMMYENEKMQGKEQPDINAYQPDAPPRKHRSLKSLNFSENDSILGFSSIAPETSAPTRPSRTRSRTSSLGSRNGYQTPKRPARTRSGSSMGSKVNIEDFSPERPSRTRSRTSLGSKGDTQLPQRPSRQRSRTDEESILSGGSYVNQSPCVEEPCIQDIRDYMGYAIVDKNRAPREPPLPPPRTPPRRRRSLKRSEAPAEFKFPTVPRCTNEAPIRPLRNYSTLSQISKSREEPQYENKENIDISQYIEIEEPRDLHSGDVVQKMRERPLPAPPRPPRKSKQHVRKSLQDITSRENIVVGDPSEKHDVLEETVSTQTEPLPDDFVCEELIEEPTDTILTPRRKRSVGEDQVKVERHLVTPTSYTHEETVTHASLIVEPLEGARILPESQLTKSSERIIPVSREESDEETSVVPEEFKKLKDPQVLKTQKLQVGDLDVDRLSVNELLANKIIVSEIESSNIQTGEISSTSGPLRIGEIELPPGLMQEIIRNLTTEVQECVQKKTPTKPDPEEEEPPVPPPRSLDSSLLSPEESPKRPPRQGRKEDEAGSQSEETTARLCLEEPEVDDEPPPRPPQPSGDYMPSQPPLSFYALRAQKYVDENIPTAPRRRRHGRSRRSRSSSPDSSRRRFRRLSEPTIPQLAGQLARACGGQANGALRRLMKHVTENVLRNADGNQDAHVMTVVLLVLIAGLVLLGYGDEKTVVHLHHWEYFNPPRDM